MARMKVLARRKKSAEASPTEKPLSPKTKRSRRRSARNAERAELKKQKALFPSYFAGDAEMMRKAGHFGVMESAGADGVPARKASEVFPPSATRTPKQIPIFDSFMLMGLVPPFSDFFMEILRAYQLKLLHLMPGAILDLAVFAHTCEAFVGVMPSVALFRHFFYPRIGGQGWMGSSVTFCFRPNIKWAFPLMETKSRWEEWRDHWFLVGVPEADAQLEEPTERPVDLDTWRSVSLQDEQFSEGVARFKLLREKEVSRDAIVAHFLRNRLAPLQKRPHPAWNFQGPGDPSRLRCPEMEENLVRDNVRGTFTPGVKYQLPKGFLPLCDDPEKDKILAQMPVCNAFGIVGRADHGPRPPVVKTRKARAPSSPEEGEYWESNEESEEESEEEFSGSDDDEGGDGHETDASNRDRVVGNDPVASDDNDEDDDDDDDGDNGEEKAAPPPHSARGVDAAPDPGAHSRSPLVVVVGNDDDHVDEEASAADFVRAPRQRASTCRLSPVMEPPAALGEPPASPQASSAASVDVPPSMGTKHTQE